jgi:hypothetical protein
VAIDGSKFKAVNNPKRHYTSKQLQELAAKIEERIEEYLKQLDTQDSESEGVAQSPTRKGLAEKLSALRERKGKYDEWLADMSSRGTQEISLTDADSRGQKRVGVGYNVQVAVDAKHALIVEPEVVQAANDLGQLSAMALAARQELQVESIKVVADAGYHEAVQLEACEKAGIETYLPAPGTTRGRGKSGQSVYPKDKFSYDAARDVYYCPASQELPRANQCIVKGKTKHYYYNWKACQGCALRSQCTTGSYRRIARVANEAVVERQAQRAALNPKLLAKRKTIVEHVFGTLRNWGHDCFLTRGLAAVRAEFSLSALTYNLRRVLHLVELPEFLKVAKQNAGV